MAGIEKLIQVKNWQIYPSGRILALDDDDSVRYVLKRAFDSLDLDSENYKLHLFSKIADIYRAIMTVSDRKRLLGEISLRGVMLDLSACNPTNPHATVRSHLTSAHNLLVDLQVASPMSKVKCIFFTGHDLSDKSVITNLPNMTTLQKPASLDDMRSSFLYLLSPYDQPSS